MVCFVARSPKSPPARRHVVSPCLPPAFLTAFPFFQVHPTPSLGVRVVGFKYCTGSRQRGDSELRVLLNVNTVRPCEEGDGSWMGPFGSVSAATLWVVVLTTWVGGGAGLDAGLAAEATPVERGIQLSTHSGCFGGEMGEGAGVPVSMLEGRRWSEPPCWVE